MTHYVKRAGRCAAQLGARVDRYDTRASVDDLADVLDALGIPTIDFYGDSYGSYFGQAFAVNHPGRLRSLVLDGTYPLPGTDPAFGDLAEATWRAYRLVCERRPTCAARGEDPLDVIGRFVARIRAHPVRGTGIDAEGNRIRVRLDADALVTIAQSGYGDIVLYRDLLAAIRAFESGDRAPMFRLVAETTLIPEASAVRSFSEGLYLAVTCHDYPQMWDPAAPLATRTPAARRGPRRAPAGPVRPVHRHRVDVARLRGRDRVPALARAAAPRAAGRPGRAVPGRADADRQRRPRQHHRELGRPRRRLAVPELDLRGDPQHDPRLGSRRPRRLCGAARPPLHPQPRRRRHELRLPDRRGPRRRPLPAPIGPRSSPRPRARATTPARAPAAPPPSALATVADAIQRWTLNYGGTDRGLRGGTWTWSGDRFVRLRFHRARFTRDVPVNGRATWRLGTGSVRARLTIPGRGTFRAHWNVRRQLATATLAGRLDGRRLRATLLAP